MGMVARGHTHMGALGPPNLEGSLGQRLGAVQPVVRLGAQGKRPGEARPVVRGRRPEKALLVRGALELVP